ncbi:MAG: WecB/TagA/CpsF family glycosyltransferase [Lentisphaerae bacterium]|nr:WecB/TagA/CpsF family glycosyltransferase [Lentisphaerota bacterium]
MEAAVRIVADWIADADGRRYVCVTGVHGVMESLRDTDIRRAHNDADMCVPDGMPLVWVGRRRGHRRMGRVYGPDLMLELCRLSADRGWRHFLYGGRAGVAERLRTRLEERFPGIVIAGTFCPPFRPLNETEERELRAAVAGAKPDLFWVGLSTPKQELFMHAYRGRLDARVMLGVGAAFDIHVGDVREAPGWVKQAGLQWFHRMCMEPRRLAGRYLRNNPAFLWHIFLQLSGLRRYP